MKAAWRFAPLVVGLQAWGLESTWGPERGRRDLRRLDGAGVRDLDTRSPGWAAAVNAENTVGLVVAVLLTMFMIAALLFPERF